LFYGHGPHGKEIEARWFVWCWGVRVRVCERIAEEEGSDFESDGFGSQDSDEEAAVRWVSTGFGGWKVWSPSSLASGHSGQYQFLELQSLSLSLSLCFLEFEVEIFSVFDSQIKVLCCVNHGDLKHLVQVSKAIREAVSILYYINQPLIVVN
jgi:hypothetical protein